MKILRSTHFCLPILVILLLLDSIGPVAGADKVDLNAATKEQLQTLPGIGPALAERVIEHRNKNGRFGRVEELMNVRGIGEKKFLKLKDFVYVGQSQAKKKQ